MIKSDNGKIEIMGAGNVVMSELLSLFVALMNEGINASMLNDFISMATAINELENNGVKPETLSDEEFTNMMNKALGERGKFDA